MYVLAVLLLTILSVYIYIYVAHLLLHVEFVKRSSTGIAPHAFVQLDIIYIYIYIYVYVYTYFTRVGLVARLLVFYLFAYIM